MPRTVPKECNVRRSWEVVLGVVCLYVYWAGTAGSGPCALVHPRSSRHRGGARLEGRNPRVRLRKPAACAVESGRVGSTAKSCKKVGSGGVPNVTSLTVNLRGPCGEACFLPLGSVGLALLTPVRSVGFGPGVISGVNLGDLVEGPISGTNPGDLAERVISGTNLGDLAEGPISGTNLGDLAERVTRAQILEIWPRGQSRALNPGDLVEGSISGTNPGDLAEELISGTNPGDLAEKVISGTNLGDLTERILVGMTSSDSSSSVRVISSLGSGGVSQSDPEASPSGASSGPPSPVDSRALRDLEVMRADHNLDTAVTEGSLAAVRERYSIPAEYGLHVP
ncbi:hypothetical protein BHE74_00030515 [Ensete ventricosum]|nr:hypothetical protein BHE74_00030515 [Ensete ventricosum]